MDVTSMNEDVRYRGDRKHVGRRNRERHREDDEHTKHYHMNMLRFIRKLINSCFVGDSRGVDKRPDRSSSGVSHLIKAIESVRQQLNSENENVEKIRHQQSSEKENKRIDKRQKAKTMEVPEVDHEWLNLVLQFLQSKELKSAMELCAHSDNCEEEIDSESSRSTRSSELEYPRLQNISHRKEGRKSSKSDEFIPRQCKKLYSSSNMKKLKEFDLKPSSRHLPLVRTQETQTCIPRKNTSLSKLPSSDESHTFDVHPNDRIEGMEDIYGPNENQNYCSTSQSTRVNSTMVDNSSPENAFDVPGSSLSNFKVPLFISYPQIRIMPQLNMSTQTRESVNFSGNSSQRKMVSGVTGVRIDRIRYPSHNYSSKFSVQERKSKHGLELPKETIIPNEIHTNEDSTALNAKSNIFSQNYQISNNGFENNTRKFSSMNIRDPLRNKSVSYGTATQSTRKYSSSYDANNFSRLTTGKNSAHYETSLPKTEEQIPGVIIKNEVPTQENGLNVSSRQISLSQNSQRNISISLEVFGNDVPKESKTNKSHTNLDLTSLQAEGHSSEEAGIPSHEIRDKIKTVQISPMSQKLSVTNTGDQINSKEYSSELEESNLTPEKSILLSSPRKRKHKEASHSGSSNEANQKSTPICTVTIHHQPSPFSCHSSKTDQTCTNAERYRSQTPPTDDCENSLRKSRSRQKKNFELEDTKKQNSTPLAGRVAERYTTRISNGDKTPELEEEQSSHTLSTDETTKATFQLTKSRSVALSPVNFTRQIAKTTEQIIQETSICDYMLNHCNPNKSLHRITAIDQQPNDTTPDVTLVKDRDSNRYSQMAINLLICQKDFFKSHLQRLSNICNILSTEKQSSKSSASSESGERRRCEKRRKKRRRERHEVLCRQVLGHYFPHFPGGGGGQQASDWDEDTPEFLMQEPLSKSSSSTSMAPGVGCPLWWETTHSLACRNCPTKRPRKGYPLRAKKGGESMRGEKERRAEYERAWSMWSNRSRKRAK